MKNVWRKALDPWRKLSEHFKSKKVRFVRRVRIPFFHRLNLANRIVIPFVVMMVIAVGTVGTIGYVEGKKSTIKQVEGRLVSEALKTINQITTLNLLNDEDFLQQRLVYELTQQKAKLAQQDLSAYQFIVKDGKLEQIPRITMEVLPIPEEDIQKMWEMDRGVIHTEVNGEPYTIAFDYSHEMSYVYAIGVKDADYMGSIVKVRNTIITAIVVCIALSFLIGWLTANGITSPIRRIMEVLQRISQGDLTEKCEFPNASPEIRSLSDSINTMREQMSNMILDVKEAVGQLQDVSQHLYESSDLSEKYSQETVRSIQVVNEGAEKTAASTEQTVRTFQQMKELIVRLVQQINETGESSESMSEDAVEGHGYLENLIGMIKGYETEIKKVHAVMEKLQEQSQSIENIVTIINGISEQTKLLALNASIEAARAGEAGKGFAVVAQEVRKLADASQKSAGEIDQIVKQIQTQTKEAVVQTDYVVQEIERGQKSASDAQVVFSKMIDGIKKTTEQVQSMLKEIEQISVATDEVESILAGYTSIAQETLASSEKMLAASHEQMETAKQSYQLSDELTSWSSSLQKKTDQFAVEKREERHSDPDEYSQPA